MAPWCSVTLQVAGRYMPQADANTRLTSNGKRAVGAVTSDARSVRWSDFSPDHWKIRRSKVSLPRCHHSGQGCRTPRDINGLSLVIDEWDIQPSAFDCLPGWVALQDHSSKWCLSLARRRYGSLGLDLPVILRSSVAGYRLPVLRRPLMV